MAEQAEVAFVKSFLNTLSNQPVTYKDDYRQPLEKSLKKVPVLPVRFQTHGEFSEILMLIVLSDCVASSSRAQTADLRTLRCQVPWPITRFDH